MILQNLNALVVLGAQMISRRESTTKVYLFMEVIS